MGSVTTAPLPRNSAATLTALYDMGHGPLPPGPSRVGRYQIRDLLGAGAMGVVYRAHDPDLGRDVAIKLVRGSSASPSNHVRLLREAQAMARLHHPNVVPIFDVGQAGDAVFVAMPLIEGGTLKCWLRGGARSFDEIVDRFLAAGRGLAAAHAAGLVHRDFKPDNVLLGAGGEIHVADFGLARLSADEPAPEASADRLAAAQITQTGAVLGTPAYMAPEQLRSRAIDARADQFSFCVALWEGIYGQRPFPDPPDDSDHPWLARLDAVAAGPAPPRRDRPAWIAPLLARGLASDPAGRWPTLQALLDAIAAHRRPRRWPWRLAIGLGAAGAAAVIAVTLRADPGWTPQVLPPVPLTHRSDLRAAAVSPDGDQLAFVASDSLVIRGSEPGAADRTVVEHGITAAITEALAWSPDGRRVLVRTTDDNPLLRQTVLVDRDRGVQFKLPVPGLASFLSSTEVAVTSPRRRSVTILPAAERAAATATCDVPGDYTFLENVFGLPDRTMAVETSSGGSRALVILQILPRGCRVRATFSGEPISSVATTDTGTLVALAVHRGFDEILEISLDGEVVSRRRVSGQLERVIGRRHGIDYVTTRARKTHLDRVQGSARRRLFSINGSASFSLAPDGETLAWIERDTHILAPGSLRLSTAQDMVQPRTLLDNATTAGWSPDGRLLAVLVDDRAGIASPPARPRPAQTMSSTLVVIDRAGTVSRRVPLQDIQPESAPVWLDDHRIATQTGDHTTYRWYDLNTAEQHELTDRGYGSTYWLTRSPGDGTLAMWRNGPPDARDAEHIWVQPPGQPARPLHVAEATKHVLVPSWSSTGELLVRALDTGVVSRIALDTGEATPIAQLPEAPASLGFEDHLMTLADGDLLATEIDLGVNVAAIYPDGEPVALSPVEPDLPR